METQNILDNENVLELLNKIKQCPENYLCTIIPGGIVRRIYIINRKVFTQPELYDMDCTYRIIVTGGYVISTTLDYKLLEYFKLNENNLKLL